MPLPGKVFASWLAIGIYVFYTGCLALCGLKEWIKQEEVAWAPESGAGSAENFTTGFRRPGSTAATSSKTWVPKAALPQLEEHVVSLKKYPPIPSGAPDPYEPPNQ